MSCIETGCAFITVCQFAMEIAETIHLHEDLIIITILLRWPAYLDKARVMLTVRYQPMPVFHRAARILHEDAHGALFGVERERTHGIEERRLVVYGLVMIAGLNIERAPRLLH